MLFVYFLASLLLLTVSAPYTVNRVTLPNDDQRYLIEVLQETFSDVTLDDAHELLYELENFYTGVRDNLWSECGPPHRIANAFHLHIINTRLYAAFCDATFGRFIHHSPFWSKYPLYDYVDEDCRTQVQKLQDHGIEIKYEDLWAQPMYGLVSDNDAVTSTVEDTSYARRHSGL